MSSREQQSLQQRWNRYEQLTTLTRHWYWRPGWRAGRSFYTWHLTFDNQPALRDLVAPLQRELHTPGLDPVPLSGLHLTMQGVGFTDEVDASRIAAIRQAARQRCAQLAPFDLALGPVDPDAEGIGLLVCPWQPVEQVRHTVRDAIASVCDIPPEPADGFRPHVTIFYSGEAIAADAVRERLRPFRDRAPVQITMRHLSLIALRQEDRVYRWDTIENVQLGNGTMSQL